MEVIQFLAKFPQLLGLTKREGGLLLLDQLSDLAQVAKLLHSIVISHPLFYQIIIFYKIKQNKIDFKISLKYD